MANIEKETEIQWIKYGINTQYAILGKDVLVLCKGNYISFLETSRTDKKEIVYQANNEVRGDGACCLCTHKSLPCFAFSELCRNPRILIVSYPNFEVMKSFESVTDTNYLDVRFSEMEFLIALTGIPDYKLVIWNWRTAEKLYSQETNLKAPLQTLRVSPTSPVQIVQWTCRDRHLVFWDMNICYKKTILNRSSVTLPQCCTPPFALIYGADGELYCSDSRGYLFSINPDTHVCVLQIPYSGIKQVSVFPCIVWHKGGLVFSCPDEVQYWRKKSPEGWVRVWGFNTHFPIVELRSSFLKELLIGVTKWNEILMIKGENQAELQTIRSFGSDFDFLCVVNPVGDYFITFGSATKLFASWTKLSGHKVGHYFWKGSKINCMVSNPRWPFLVAVTEAGEVRVINVSNPSTITELDEFSLMDKSLDAIRFRKEGMEFCVANTELGMFFLIKFQPSPKLEIIAYMKTDLKIVDFAICEKDSSTQLLIVPMSQLCCRSGQTMIVYNLNERNKTFDFYKDITLPSVVTSILPSPFSTKEILCTPHRSRKLFIVNSVSGKLVQELITGHQMKFISTQCVNDNILTYGMDGIVILKSAQTKKCVSLFATHHRLTKGIKNLVHDVNSKYIVTLGENGSIVCTHLKKVPKLDFFKSDTEFSSTIFHQKANVTIAACTEEKPSNVIQVFYSHDHKKFSSTPTEATSIGSKNKKMMWLEHRQQELLSMEEQNCKKEKQIVQEEFLDVKKKLTKLLDENYENVPEKQLPVQAFDLDKAGRRKKIEDAKAEREKDKQFQMASIKNLNRITEMIKTKCWDSVEVKGRELHGIFSPVVVHSYALETDPPEFNQTLTMLQERMRMEQFFRRGDYFEPWIPRTKSALDLHINAKFQVSSLDVTQTIKTKFEEDQMEEEKAKQESEERKQKYVWTGTSTHNFIDADPNHYSQFELTTFPQCHQEIILCQADIKKLMLWFNKEFNDMFAMKEREMANVLERNNRFRHIIKELSFFNFSPHICKTQIFDPKWAPGENPETIITVDDSEVLAAKYISESSLDILKRKDDDRQQDGDNFKEKALMVMMDGVLEKLWEDELKKDVPKPKCMLEKEVENYLEEDIKAVKAYEEAVKFLMSERERYRKLLEVEWAKTISMVKDSVYKFDEKVVKLHLQKLKVESAIGQEILKCLRIRQLCCQREQMERKKENIKKLLMKNEKKIESMSTELNKLSEMLNDCKNFYETLQNRDKNLDRNFKREFPDYSPMICEQLYKQSKKRPKLFQKAAAYSSVLSDMGKCVVSGAKPEHMPQECIQYLKDIDALDAHSNCPATVNQQAWELTCKLRRIKIECELKIRACAVDLADAETTVLNYQKALKAAKEYQAQLQNELQAVRNEKLNLSLNYQIQLVLKKGLVEIPLTGQLSDFNECVLVSKDTLNDVNKNIQLSAKQKLKAMKKAANFRKGIIYKEWEHKKLRMDIEDLKNELETVEKLQVMKELQAILVARARGFSDEKGFLYLENEIAAVKEKFKKAQYEIYSKIDELEIKIEKIEIQNQELDEELAELNVEVNEMNLGRDKDFDDKNLAENMKRMKKVRERSKLVRTIQDQHKEILMLQTELELLRLKTYPVIKPKA